MTASESISKNLNYQMKKQNISVKEMADKLKVSVTLVRGFLSGKSSPRIAVLRKICVIFNVTADYMLGITDEFGNKISY